MWGLAGRGRTRRGLAGPGLVRQGHQWCMVAVSATYWLAMRGMARPGMVWPGQAGPGETRVPMAQM
jgi:hypothetical protein